MGGTTVALKRLAADYLWQRATAAPKPWLDIGAGSDPLPGAETYDLAQGDANLIVNRTPGSYGLVYSSHCLEHMVSPLEAFRRWWEMVGPGGWLWVIVPDMMLYEHGQWPSRFNADHKWMFSINRQVEHPRHLNAFDLIRLCPGGELMRLQLCDAGYNYSLPPTVDQSSDAEVAIEIVVRRP